MTPPAHVRRRPRVRYWCGPSFHMLAPLFHRWERRLASAATDRLVRPFSGVMTGSRRTVTRARSIPAQQLEQYVADVLADTDAFYTPSPTAAYQLHASPRRRTCAPDVPERARHAARREQRRARAVLPGASGRAARQARGAGAPAVELGRGRAHRPRAAARALRHERAAPEPALSRLAHAARAHAAPTTSSAPTSAGRCRCAGRPCSTRGARSGWLRDQGYERIGILGTSLGSCLSMLTAAHEPLRHGAGAQPHLAVLRRRRVARAVDAARARGARGPRRRSTTCGGCGCRSARGRSSTASATCARCSSTRSTT